MQDHDSVGDVKSMAGSAGDPPCLLQRSPGNQTKVLWIKLTQKISLGQSHDGLRRITQINRTMKTSICISSRFCHRQSGTNRSCLLVRVVLLGILAAVIASCAHRVDRRVDRRDNRQDIRYDRRDYRW
jgi:hypothetical protein